MNTLSVKDMANMYIEHSMVINNFVTTVGNQLKSSLRRVFGDGVKYKWIENDNKPMITEKNKEELKLYMFPHVKIDFDELFDGMD